MIKWSLRTLTAFLTFAIGVCTTGVVRLALEASAKVQAVYVIAKTQGSAPLKMSAESSRRGEGRDEVMQPHFVSISPYEIKRLIEKRELQPCQRRGYSGYLHLGPILDKLNLETSDDDGVFPQRCGSPPNAYMYWLELDDEAGKETLLRIDFGMPESTLYLIFKRFSCQSGTEWKLLGYVPYVYGAPFSPPTHRVVTGGHGQWLAIQYVVGHGSAFGSSAEDWYEIGEGGVTRVLGYQTGLFIGMSNPAVESDTKILDIMERDGLITVHLQKSTSFDDYRNVSAPLHLWTSKKKITFIKGPGMEKFMFDPFHSEMPEELDPTLADDSVIGKDFVKYNYRELLSIARERFTERKTWLFEFLKTLDDSVEKNSLLQTAALNEHCSH